MGECYNYRLLDAAVVFRVLYWLVPLEAGTWGHVAPQMHISAHAEAAAGGGAADAADAYSLFDQDSLFDRDLLIDRNHMSECVCENPGCS